MPGRTAQLIRYFVEKVPGLGRTRLVKLLYMTDHESRRYLGRPLTDLRYRWDNFGPYDSEILRQIQLLRADDKLIETQGLTAQGYDYYSYEPTSKPVPQNFSTEDRAILDYVTMNFAKPDLQDLLDSVYQTRPMTDVSRRGELLEMDVINNELRIPGAELEHILHAAAELRSGGGYDFEELL